MIVLGIETSCDETGVAVYDSRAGLRSHCLYSQIRTHAPFGGIVPELASRDHIRKLMPLVQQAMAEAGVTSTDLDGLAYTAGPGLVGALLVGATTGVGLGLAWNLPVVPVHHMEAHLLAVLLEPDPPAFPFLALLVSGGHSMLVQVEELGKYRILGETLDDAVGEAFDKGAKLLGLPYPGGPHLARLAAEGHAGRYRFPRPMARDPGLDFSFSGLKTALAVRLRDLERSGPVTGEVRADLANGYQEALVDSLVAKTARAVEVTGLTRVVVAGGVGANQLLRARLRSRLATSEAAVYYPRAEFCTDNAAMVALTGCLRLAAGKTATGKNAAAGDRLTVEARARWSLEEL